MKRYVKFSEEQLRLANNVDLSDFLKRQGEPLEKSGREIRWMKNSSVTIRGNKWFQHKYQEGGYPIQFLQKFYNYSFPDAVQVLLNEAGIPYEQYHAEDREVKGFHPQRRNPTLKRVYGYLLKQRCINAEVLNDFVKNNLIYESEKYHNIVFAGYDEEGVMRHALKKSTYGTYRGNETGSDPRYSFHWKGTSDRIMVFEAPIDMLSYISIHKEEWKKRSYVALNGVSIQPLLHQLEMNRELRNVYLCLDHDIAGDEAMACIRDELCKHGHFLHVRKKVARYKDWNEDLKVMKGREALPAVDNPKYRMFDNLLNKYESMICSDHEGIQVKDMMDDYLDFSSKLNKKDDLIEVRESLLKLSSDVMSLRKLIHKNEKSTMEEMKDGFLTHKDRGNLKKRVEQLMDSIYRFRDAYVHRDLENRSEKIVKYLLDIADDSMMVLAYLDMQEELLRYKQEEINMEQNRKPKCPLIGTDGNVFALIGMTQKSLRAIGEEEQAKEVLDRVINCGSYDEALNIMQEYVDVTSIDEFSIQVFMELGNLQSNLRNTVSKEDMKEMSIDIMISENTEEALEKIENYKSDLLPSMGMKIQ